MNEHHDPKSTPIVLSAVPTGWATLLAETFDALNGMCPEWRPVVIKEKWAELRLQVDLPHGTTDATHAAVAAMLREAAVRSLRTCDVCGVSGDLFAPDHPEWPRGDARDRIRCVPHRDHTAVHGVLLADPEEEEVIDD